MPPCFCANAGSAAANVISNAANVAKASSAFLIVDLSGSFRFCPSRGMVRGERVRVKQQKCSSPPQICQPGRTTAKKRSTPAEALVLRAEEADADRKDYWSSLID